MLSWHTQGMWLRSILAGALLLAGASNAAAQCEPDSTRLCLQDDRFELEVDWSNPYGSGAGRGRVETLSRDTGAFWFFDPKNLELTVKVLDGRPVDGHFWVFWGSLSTVEFTLTVHDRERGWLRSYRNPAFEQTAGSDTAAFPDRLIAGGSVLVVIAHPDDEVIAAPLLGELCRERGLRCGFLVATRGEAGECELPGGCLPDLATVREREMAASAALFGAELVQWQLADSAAGTPGAVRQAWADSAGGSAALAQAMRAAVDDFAADTILTFDPRHGSTCHPDHRALGALVRDAVAGSAADLWFLGTRVDLAGTVPTFSAAAATDPGLRTFDGQHPAPLLGLGATSWGWLLAAATAHPSQIDASRLAALGTVPSTGRRTHLVPGRGWDANDPRYAGLCGNGG